MTRSNLPPIVLVACLLATLPTAVVAQRRGAQPVQASWAPISVGAHFGYDENSNGEVVGAQIRIPVVRSGVVELMPNASVTFGPALREYQVNLDGVFLPGGRRGGLYLGAGVAFRNTVFGLTPAAGRETRTGVGLFVGTKFAGATLHPQLELRWTFMPDTPLDPRLITFGVSFPLWGSGSRSGGG